MSQVLFFEPQTGIYKDLDWESNFYHFRLDGRYSWSVTMSQWLDRNIAEAEVGSGGLIYTEQFMTELDDLEQSLDRIVKGAEKLGMTCPQKLPDQW
jgi:hypothetical protein